MSTQPESGTEGVEDQGGVEAVVEEPTFTETLANAIRAFQAGVSDLKASQLGVDTAEEQVVTAQQQLATAQASHRGADQKRADVRAEVLDSRDGLVAVLQSWNP